MSDDPKAVQVRITGIVQGVGFRDWTRHEAMGLGLTGWVRNEADGSVAALLFSFLSCLTEAATAASKRSRSAATLSGSSS